jgi:hypothetical protein
LAGGISDAICVSTIDKIICVVIKVVVAGFSGELDAQAAAQGECAEGREEGPSAGFGVHGCLSSTAHCALGLEGSTKGRQKASAVNGFSSVAEMVCLG